MLRLTPRAGLLLFFLWLLAGLLPAAATHLVGGELTYEYLDATGGTATPFRYRITARVYFNKEADSRFPDGAPDINIVVFSQATGGTRLLQRTVQRSNFNEITPAAAPGCPVLAPRVTLAIYNATVSLPDVPEGYRTEFSVGNRNFGIANLVNSGSESMTLVESGWGFKIRIWRVTHSLADWSCLSATEHKCSACLLSALACNCREQASPIPSFSAICYC